MRYTVPFLLLFCPTLIAGCSDTEQLTLSRKARGVQQPPTANRSALPVDSSRLCRGQLLYAPVYSELLFFEEKVKKLTAANLSIRNTSIDHGLQINFVDYYDDHGQLLRNYLTEPLRLGPLGSTTFTVEQGDRSAGAGANFLVEWTADTPVEPPIVETITIQYMGPRGLSFRSPSQVLREKD